MRHNWTLLSKVTCIVTHIFLHACGSASEIISKFHSADWSLRWLMSSRLICIPHAVSPVNWTKNLKIILKWSNLATDLFDSWNCWAESTLCGYCNCVIQSVFIFHLNYSFIKTFWHSVKCVFSIHFASNFKFTFTWDIKSKAWRTSPISGERITIVS